MLRQLKQADVFYDLDTEQLEKIQAICTQVTLEKGTVIFEENSPGDKMYVVIRGAVDVQVDPKTLGLETDTGPTTIATLRQGQTFGELVLVDQGLRSASAQVATHTARLFVIKRNDLISLCEKDYKLGYLIMRNIAAEMAFKIRGTDLIVREQLLWRPRE
jgi:CRP-like cAMP-binding protein